jgi:MYXO-CTERM domain-containing protein
MPVVPVVTTGFCQPKILVCTSKADCPANLDCVKETAMVKRPACAPDTTCDTTLPPPSETGTCKAVCNVDSDCPAPLICKLQGQTCMGGGSVSSDGTVTTIPTTCTGGNKICSYQAVTCSTDAECTAPNYQCAKVSEYQSCTGSATPNCPKSVADAGVTCPPAQPPVCTSTVEKNCMPKEIKCDAGQSCPSGWSCFDFTYFDNASVPGWSTPMPSQACLPDGLILTIKGQANGGSGATYSGSNPTRGGAGETGGTGTVDLGGKGGDPSVPVTNTGDPIPPQVTPVPSSDGQEHATPSDAGTEASTKVRGGGCSMGGAQDSSIGLGLTLALAGLVLRLSRRRK